MGFRHPLDLLGAALAVLLAVLGALQLRASGQFSAQAVPATATIVALETPKRGLLDAQGDSIATVEFEALGTDARGDRAPGADGAGRTKQTATLAQPLARIGIDPADAIGMTIPVRYDPSAPGQVQYGTQTGREVAWVLFALAAGALVAPRLLRRAQLSSGGG